MAFKSKLKAKNKGGGKANVKSKSKIAKKVRKAAKLRKGKKLPNITSMQDMKKSSQSAARKMLEGMGRKK